MADDRHYVPGDFYRIDDRTGFKVRAKRTRKEWTNLIVDQDRWEPRHPQDFVKGVIDDQTVPEPRPRQTDVFLGPLETTLTIGVGYPLLLEDGSVFQPPLIIEPVGVTTTVNVASATRILIGDTVQIMLDNGQFFTTTVVGVPSLTSITLAAPVPAMAAAGNIVQDLTANAMAVI